MKAAVVFHCFPHYRAAVLRELLESKEHDYVLVGDDRAIDPTIKKWEIEDRNRFILAPCRRYFSLLHIQRGLVRLALRKDLGAIVFIGKPYFIATWFSAALARLTGKRVLFWTIGWSRSDGGVKDVVRNLFYKLADGLLLYGHVAKMLGLDRGFPAERLHVVYNSLDYQLQREIRESVTAEEVEAIRRDLALKPGVPVVIWSSRLSPQRRLDLLIKAQATLRDEGHLVHVLLVGDGPERASLQGLAERLQVPVKFYGACYDERVLARLTMAAHVTVAPGMVGLTGMQSLAYGTPVITHSDHEAQAPESEAIQPGRTGDFFRREDVSDLARVIKKWTSTPEVDPSIRTACHQVLDRFYNPSFQRRVIDRAVHGEPADDLFWMKEQSRRAGGPAVLSELIPC